MIKEMVIAGPVYSAATIPVMENSPAPIITPTPNATKPQGPKTRFSVDVPSSEASASGVARGFLIKRPIYFSCLI
jgi:hypothetical protein